MSDSDVKLLDACAELGRLTFDLQIQLQKVENRVRILQSPREFHVITLCGSTRFKDEFERINRELTLDGNVVLSVGVFGHADGVSITDEQKKQLDEIHFQKIDMSDEVFVVNVGGYIGSSTKREIEHAKCQGIPVRYLVEIKDNTL